MVVCCKLNARKSVTSTSPDYRYKERYHIRKLTLIDKEDTDGMYVLVDPAKVVEVLQCPMLSIMQDLSLTNVFSHIKMMHMSDPTCWILHGTYL